MRYSPGQMSLSFFVVLFAALATGQTSGNPQKAAPDQQIRTVKVGIALMTNQSLRAVSPTWERNQLVQSLSRLRKDRKSPVVIDAIPLESNSREDAGAEAARQDCQYFVLTTLLDERRDQGVFVGPGGLQPPPITIGSVHPYRRIAMNFRVFDVGAFRTLAEGSAGAPNDDQDDTRAADEAMRITALRVASEIRKERPPSID